MNSAVDTGERETGNIISDHTGSCRVCLSDEFRSCEGLAAIYRDLRRNTGSAYGRRRDDHPTVKIPCLSMQGVVFEGK